MTHFEEPPEEPTLAFDFGDNWNVVKFDNHPFYQKQMKKIPETKAIDFLGILNDNELYLIEVKDFRQHRIQTKDRLSSGELAIELAQKVRDSLACIIGAYHTSSNPDYWQPYVRLLGSRHESIKIVLWLENDPPPSHPRLRQKAMASISGKVFKKKLTWLTSRVLVCGNDKRTLPNVTVSSLPRN